MQRLSLALTIVVVVLVVASQCIAHRDADFVAIAEVRAPDYSWSTVSTLGVPVLDCHAKAFPREPTAMASLMAPHYYTTIEIVNATGCSGHVYAYSLDPAQIHLPNAPASSIMVVVTFLM